MKKNLVICSAFAAIVLASGAAFAGPVPNPLEIKTVSSSPSERSDALIMLAEAKQESQKKVHPGKKNGVGGGLNVVYGAAEDFGNQVLALIGNMSRIRTVAFT